jgi:hypothetical protein
VLRKVLSTNGTTTPDGIPVPAFLFGFNRTKNLVSLAK